ncbi:MAG: hypothetical protein B7Z10_00055 [Rhodobacterales bacterium 32-66-7]|nr:MAG: hypothetical protein B7Z10_00055 [Rhodobacterales bacterium 32-66-7]
MRHPVKPAPRLHHRGGFGRGEGGVQGVRHASLRPVAGPDFANPARGRKPVDAAVQPHISLCVETARSGPGQKESRMNLSFLKAALIALACMVSAGQAAAQSTVDISVCNRTANDALVAISFQPVGAKPTDWRNQGWFTVLSGDCNYIASTAVANFYLYAEVAGNQSVYWGGNYNLCVVYPGPYDYLSRGGNCKRGQTAAPFVSLSADQFGPYTWNLDP